MFIELRNATKIYPENQMALDNVSFSLEKGQIIGLLGVNGSGKTTCSGILAGLHTMTSGTLLFCGQDTKHDIAQYKSNIGYCPQNSTLNDNITVYDNLVQNGLFHGMDQNAAQQATQKVIDLLNLHKYIDKLPTTLSGGWVQRIMIARTIIHDPEFVILDEPTMGLDPSIRHTIWKIIEQMKAHGRTVVLVTHYLDEAELLCDKFIILDAGKIVCDCSKEELKKANDNQNLEAIFAKLNQEAHPHE